MTLNVFMLLGYRSFTSRPPLIVTLTMQAYDTKPGGRVVASPQVVASSLWDWNQVPQDLIEGVVATFIGITLLFLIRPRFHVALTGAKAGDAGASKQPSKTFGFQLKNKSLFKATEVRVRLLRISPQQQRKEIPLVASELFEIRGQLSPLEPSRVEIWCAHRARLTRDKSKRQAARADIGELRERRVSNRGDRALFTFCPVGEELENELARSGAKSYFVFQVVGKNPVTGFSKFYKRRFDKRELGDFSEKPDADRSGTGSR